LQVKKEKRAAERPDLKRAPAPTTKDTPEEKTAIKGEGPRKNGVQGKSQGECGGTGRVRGKGR